LLLLRTLQGGFGLKSKQYVKGFKDAVKGVREAIDEDKELVSYIYISKLLDAYEEWIDEEEKK